MPALRAFLYQVFDFVFEDEKVRAVFAGEPDEGMIVVLNRAGDLLAVGEPYPYRDLGLDQVLEVPYFFEGLLGRAIPGLAAVS